MLLRFPSTFHLGRGECRLLLSELGVEVENET